MKTLILAVALGLASPALAQDAPPPADQSAQANYPTCSRTVKDKCIQKGARQAAKKVKKH